MFEDIYRAVLKAGEIFKEGFYNKKEIKYKGVKDLLTDYDIKIEEFLKYKLEEFGYKFIAEESEWERDLNYTVIIDPIDGTTNFAHAIPFCAISVAVYKEGECKEAFVYNPIMQEYFFAKKGEGAFLNGNKITVSQESNIQQSLISTGFPYSSKENPQDLKWVVDKMQKVLPNVQDIRRFGSASLDLCYVACGKLEGFYEINLKPWDVAAGMLIIQEASGRVSNDKGEDFDIFEDKCIVASNSHIHGDFLKLLN
ncbi:MAG: inositol monophosphatase [Epsilonproteobacteria bacterium]|nr:inositol monophosphatase [Campylobacterota bacterium]